MKIMSDKEKNSVKAVPERKYDVTLIEKRPFISHVFLSMSMQEKSITFICFDT